MKPRVLVGSVCVCVCALAACGLEGMFTNVPHRHYDRPASKLQGAVSWPGANIGQLAILDPAGNVDPDSARPFDKTLDGSSFQIQLPSGSYSFLRVRGRAGNMQVRALVPFVGEESAVGGVNLDARGMTETLIVEAWLSAQDPQRYLTLAKLSPGAYVGDGVTSGTRTMIHAALDADPATATSVQKATQDLLHMVERILARTNVNVSGAPTFFLEPAYDTSWNKVTSALSPDLFPSGQPGFDYDGVAGNESSADKFDAKLAEVAQRYVPEGCTDDSRMRLVFSVDFNEGALNGNCGVGDRFKWAKDAPGKQMYFVGWIHKESAIQDNALNAYLGGGVPNQLAMHDDGTNGDEVAGDNIWTIAFDVPYTGTVAPLRVGYKYTWGTRGAAWTGSEEWPGNSRILEVVDVNGDHFVHRRDVFGDEASNKDVMNLNYKGTGVVTWTTVLFGAPAGCTDHAPLYEAREKPVTLHSACTCGSDWMTPRSIGPVRKACTQ